MFSGNVYQLFLFMLKLCKTENINVANILIMYILNHSKKTDDSIFYELICHHFFLHLQICISCEISADLNYRTMFCWLISTFFFSFPLQQWSLSITLTLSIVYDLPKDISTLSRFLMTHLKMRIYKKFFTNKSDALICNLWWYSYKSTE